MVSERPRVSQQNARAAIVQATSSTFNRIAFWNYTFLASPREIDRVYYINANSECEFNDYSRAMCSSNQH
jgi:hypothetical protein